MGDADVVVVFGAVPDGDVAVVFDGIVDGGGGVFAGADVYGFELFEVGGGELSVGAGDVDGVGCVEACMAEGCGGVVGVGYLVDGVDCHAVVSLFVGGDEEDSVVGVEGFPVEEGGDGSHCWCSLSVFNDWGEVSLVGLVGLGGGLRFSLNPLCLDCTTYL